MKGMFKLLFSNADEELEKLKILKQEIEEINKLELSKMFVGVEDIQKTFGCCKRRAQDFFKLPGLEVIKLGSEPYVNIGVLYEFTKQRIVMSEINK